MRPRDLETLEYPRVLDAIATFARSEGGRTAVQALLPTSDASEAESRLDALGELAALATETGRVPLGDVPLLAPALALATPEGAALEPQRLMEVRDVLEVARQVRLYLGRDPERFPTLAARAGGLPEVLELERALKRSLEPGGQVRDDASPALAAARAATRDLRAQIEARLLRLVRDPEHDAVFGEQYVTVRNGRLVVPVRIHAASQVEGVVQDRSGSGETLFIEPLFAVDLNNRLLLATQVEEQEERRVRAELTDLVRSETPALATLDRSLSELDALAAAAEFAARHRCVRPVLGPAEIALEAARHPLLAASGRRIVPIDLRLRPDQQGLAVTGPNAGGKTVALKTLGLCALMAQSGLFVPAAEGSRLPVFDAILADIGDEQSIERDLSTFSAHASNLAAIAEAATPGALVLLDEPGAGTDPIEGAALAQGAITDLLARGPRIVFTTHFPQVKAFALSEPGLEVAAFDVDPASGAPRYVLSYHTVGQSLALPIARRHGLPARALEVAERLLAGESRDLARAIARLEDSRRRLEESREALAAERAKLAEELGQAETLVADLRARQRRRWADDLEESRRFVRDVEERGRRVLEELEAKPTAATLAVFVKETRAAIAQREAELPNGTPPPARPPCVGDTVEVVGRGIRGELVESSAGRARIQRGGMRFEVPADQLRVVDAPPAPRPKVTVAVAPPAGVTDEIQLIGMRARDAVDALAAFLDRAMRAGAAEVRVVHGVGTGALRKVIQEFLATSPYCARYRDADQGAGGMGVTIAELV